MRYIALDDNATPAPATQPDALELRLRCLKAVEALQKLGEISLEQSQSADRRGLDCIRNYYGGRADMCGEAVAMLQSILTGSKRPSELRRKSTKDK